MKRLVVILLGMAFLIGASAFAINPPDSGNDKTPVIKSQVIKPGAARTIPRETRMRATGIVKELTAETLIIERTVTAELMEFYLEKALDKIKAGDKVTVSYVNKEEKNIAKRVGKIVPMQKKKRPAPLDSAPVSKQPPAPAK
ncbi:MAG: hypothetical protein PHN75_00680 [Syntrophales bacterium]|nr:hypothetical protein [Syntrophales bacterium]